MAVDVSVRRALSFGAVAAGMGMVASFARGKLAAVWLGADGSGALATSLQLGALWVTPLTATINAAVLPELRTKDSATLRHATLLALVLSPVGIVGAALHAAWEQGMVAATDAALGACVMALSVLPALTQQLFALRGDMRRAAAEMTALAAATTLVPCLAMVTGEIRHCLALQALVALVGLWRLSVAARVTGLGSAFLPVQLERARWGRWALIAGHTLVSAFAGQLALVLVRTRLPSAALGGLFQSAWSLSSLVPTLLLGQAAALLFARMGQLSGVALARQADAALWRLLLMAAPLSAVSAALAPELLRVLYSEAFVGAAPLVCWMVAAGVLKVASWIYAGALLYHGKLRAYVAAEVAAALVLIVPSDVLAPLTGGAPLTGVGVAFVASFVVHLLLGRWFAGRLLARELSWWPAVAALLASAAVLGLGLLRNLA